jgi:hypothetical protein
VTLSQHPNETKEVAMFAISHLIGSVAMPLAHGAHEHAPPAHDERRATRLSAIALTALLVAILVLYALAR